MICFDVFTTYHKAMIHRGVQASFVAVTTRIYARLHIDIVHVVSFHKVIFGATSIQCGCLKEKATDMNCILQKIQGETMSVCTLSHIELSLMIFATF